MSTARYFLAAVSARRSLYGLGRDSSIDEKEIIRTALLNVPSAFNTQTTRIVLLLNDDHERLWDLTARLLHPLVRREDLDNTLLKLRGFKAAHGTILFFEDRTALENLRANPKAGAYHQHFEAWSQQTNGMHQFTIWTALHADGIGANLQHYNPLIDDEVKASWSIDSRWRLTCQMPFGKAVCIPKDKNRLPVEDRLLCFGDKEKL